MRLQLNRPKPEACEWKVTNVVTLVTYVSLIQFPVIVVDFSCMCHLVDHALLDV